MSSGGEGPDIDPTVGGLVWVRRRNGSWWPGRIMGLDELPEGSLVSPRSGTPVKLLGREDASVDWYNLERSKRVKPFRCGEYDDCIEKAKAAANANKKAVKYARRDDAILHALEIESAQEPKDMVEFIPRTDNSGSEQDFSSSEDSPTVSDSATTEDSDEETDTDTSTSAMELSQSGTSFEETNHISVPKVQSLQGRRRRTPNDSEDDGNEGIKRMRGLEDLGLGMVSKKNVQPGKILEDVYEDDVSIDNHMTIGSLANGGKDKAPSLKRKRSQAAHVQEFLKRKDRRRPLTKVLEKSPMLVSVPITFDPVPTPSASPLHGVSDNKVSRLDNSNNSTGSAGLSNERGVIANASERVPNVSHNQNKLTENCISSMSGFPGINSDMLYEVPLVVEEENYYAGSHMTTSSFGQPKFGAQFNEAETALLENEGLHEVSLTTSATTYSNISQMMEKDTSSMWQSKGKRKSRRMSKSIKHDLKIFVDADDESDDYLVGVEHNNGFSHWGKDPTSYGEPQRSLPYRQSRFSVHPKYDEMEDYPIKNLRLRSSLYDVVLEVKASYRPQHVPLVSLMSKLNGKAIVGHPLTVEVLDDGTSDHLVNSIYEFGYAAKSNMDVGKDARFSPKKSPRNRKSGLSSKKTRKLSSLTSFQKIKEENRKPFVEKLNGPAIACIPLKVVFTRLNEAVSGSARPSHRVLSENIS